MDKNIIETIAEALFIEKYRAFNPIWEKCGYQFLYRRKAENLIDRIRRGGYKIVEEE